MVRVRVPLPENLLAPHERRPPHSDAPPVALRRARNTTRGRHLSQSEVLLLPTKYGSQLWSRFAQEPLTAGAAVCEVSDDDGAKGARTFFDRHRAQLRRLGVGLLYVMLCALLLARELRPTS